MSPQREASGVDGAVELVCGGIDRPNGIAGWCIARMLERGERVEMLTQNPGEPRTWEPADPYDFQSTDRTFYVARILPPPATQTIRADELRPGMVHPTFGEITCVQIRTASVWFTSRSRERGPFDHDAPVTVLSPVPTGEGTGA